MFNKRLSRSTLVQPTAGPIASRIHQLTTKFVQEMARPDKDKLDDFIDMLERDPVSKACAELKALRATIAVGEYENQNKEHQEWIRDNFNYMEGSIKNIVGQLCSAMPLGFAVAEIIMYNDIPGYRGQWRLGGINVLDPRRLTFAGQCGNITHIVYTDGQGNKKWIPYSKCIHIVNGFTTNFSRPYGSAEAKRAYQYFKAKQIVLAEMTVAAKNNATGILVGKAESNDQVVLLGQDGKPFMENGRPKIVPSTQSLMYQMQNLENSSIIVTDKKNDILPLQVGAGEGFWQPSLAFLNNMIMLAFGVPSLIFSEGSGGLGNAGLSQQHRTILDSQIESIVLQIRDEIIEKIVRPLLVFNFGEKSEWGSFSQQASTDPTLVAARVGNVMMGLQTGIFPTSDLDVINKLRDDLDLPPIDEARMAELLQKQAEIQAQQQAAMAPADPNQMGQQPYP